MKLLCFGLRRAAITHMAVISWALQFYNHDHHHHVDDGEEGEDDDDDDNYDDGGWGGSQLSSWQ